MKAIKIYVPIVFHSRKLECKCELLLAKSHHVTFRFRRVYRSTPHHNVVPVSLQTLYTGAMCVRCCVYQQLHVAKYNRFDRDIVAWKAATRVK